MITYDPNQYLISLHVGGTGGTTMKIVYREWFGAKFHHVVKERPVNHDAIAQPGACIHSHFSDLGEGSVYDMYPSACQFITFFRDPLEQVTSNFFYWRKENKRCGDYAENLKGIPNLENCIFRATSNMLDFMPIKLTHENYRDFFESNFVFIGVTAQLQASIDTLAECLGKPKVDIPKLNANPRNEVASDEAKEHFKSKHALEYEIYEYALSRHLHMSQMHD